MKFAFSFLLSILFLGVTAQDYPSFNPLVNIFKSKTLNEVYNELNKQKEFTGEIIKDTVSAQPIIKGFWQ